MMIMCEILLFFYKLIHTLFNATVMKHSVRHNILFDADDKRILF